MLRTVRQFEKELNCFQYSNSV